MLSLISPAKTLDFDTPAPIGTSTKPAMLDDSQLLIDELRELSAARISSLMGISDSLGELNRDRYAAWSTPFTRSNAKQALFAFMGDVYRGIDAASLAEDDLKYAQQHLRILSGLYGVLRPLDLIQAYRLEMGTKLTNERGEDLYAFWGDKITNELNKQLKSIKSGVVANLASNEYFKSVRKDALKADIVAPVFLDEKNGKYKIISFYAKKARGFMTAWIMQNRIEDPNDLKKFKVEGYQYSAELSKPGEPAFVRDEQ